MDSPPPRSSTKEKYTIVICDITRRISWWLRVEPFALKNLPQDATIAFVEAAFQHFGEIRRGGIEVRNKKGFSYGFLEFKEASAAEKAIEASPLKLAVGGGNVYVEKKRPDYISYWETPPSYGPGTKSRSEAMTGEVDDKLGNLLKPSGAAYDSASMKLHAKNHGGANNHHESNNCSTRTQLFQKELTPSDVGKLNRLVIPKKHAVKYMPFISDEQGEKEGVEDVEVVFYDRAMRQWKFRYCYWRSSQSFVFTRGWNGFVKEKNLKANDIIVFYTCNDPGESKNYLMIDVQGSTSDEVPEEVNQTVQDNTSDEEVITQNPLSPELEDKETKSEENNKGGFKLFGVMIQQ